MKKLVAIPDHLVNALSDSLVLNRLKSQLKAEINIKRNNEIGMANRLAVYWYALNSSNYSKDLINCFAGQIDFNPNNRSLWHGYCQGMLFQLELSDESEYADRSVILEIVDKNDIVSHAKRKKFLADEGRSNNFLSLRVDTKESLSLAEIETQKYQCEIYAQLVLDYVYCKHMLPLENPRLADSVSDEIEENIKLSTKYLGEALIKRRNSSEHRSPFHEQFR